MQQQQPGLKIITWNVWFDPSFQTQRIQAIIKEIQHYQPDVVCLQEITKPILHIILTSIDTKNYVVWFDEHSADPYGQIFIANKKTVGVTAFGSEPFLETRMSRRIYYLRLNNQTTILNVHLESEFTGSPKGTKAKQLSYLLQYAKDKFGSDTIFIAGDLNLAHQDDKWSQNMIRSLGFADISPLNHNYTYDYLKNTNILGKYQSCLDRILTNIRVRRKFRLTGQNPLKVVENPEIYCFASDHFGIYMHIVTDQKDTSGVAHLQAL
jgi:exonuclease III